MEVVVHDQSLNRTMGTMETKIVRSMNIGTQPSACDETVQLLKTDRQCVLNQTMAVCKFNWQQCIHLSRNAFVM